MSRDLILRSRAAKYLNTSIVVMTDNEYHGYLTHLINFNYPNLANSKETVPLYNYLTFQSDKLPENIDPYEWWLGVPTGPQSCSRDIGEVRELFGVSKGDEWDTQLEEKIKEYQEGLVAYLLPTGYVCAETLRRKRMVI